MVCFIAQTPFSLWTSLLEVLHLLPTEAGTTRRAIDTDIPRLL